MRSAQGLPLVDKFLDDGLRAGVEVNLRGVQVVVSNTNERKVLHPGLEPWFRFDTSRGLAVVLIPRQWFDRLIHERSFTQRRTRRN